MYVLPKILIVRIWHPSDFRVLINRIYIACVKKPFRFCESSLPLEISSPAAGRALLGHYLEFESAETLQVFWSTLNLFREKEVLKIHHHLCPFQILSITLFEPLWYFITLMVYLFWWGLVLEIGLGPCTC